MDQAIKSYKVEKVISSIEKLPTLPTIYVKISHLIEASDSTIKIISNTISEDQAIAVMVLKLVNSAFYGFSQTIGSLQRAIVILGLNEIKNLVLTTSILKTIKLFKSGHIFDLQEFWKHSIGCAVSARVLAETAYLKNPEEVFAGGLLHDIGKLIHATYLSEEFAEVVADVDETGLAMFESEEKILGFNHAQMGSVLAKKWRLPQETINMIAYHHMPDMPATLAKEIAAVHIGNTLCTALRLGSGGEKRIPVVNQKAWKVLDLKLNDLEYVMIRTAKLFEESISILGF
ncbi:MAG: HDOD domain-containing protein [Proteobacteria bacterium]|nr:HDOD domain-containing protein [Pseudomonadota bacterium]